MIPLIPLAGHPPYTMSRILHEPYLTRAEQGRPLSRASAPDHPVQDEAFLEDVSSIYTLRNPPHGVTAGFTAYRD